MSYMAFLHVDIYFPVKWNVCQVDEIVIVIIPLNRGHRNGKVILNGIPENDSLQVSI